MSRNNLIAVYTGCILVLLLATGCRENYTPKPHVYFRIDFPEKTYRLYSADCPYSFEYPAYGTLVDFNGKEAEPCWKNIEFPQFKCTIHLTYKPVNNNLSVFLEDIRALAYKHSIKADDIVDQPFYYPERNVYGMFYEIKGNTASSLSFFATDSLHNFLSGSLYFNVHPNIDSLAPSIAFFKKDVEHLIETLNWK